MTPPETPGADALHHHSRAMRGCDRHEVHRVATPLELLFDLTFVISFGLAASQLAHALAEAHVGAGLLGFGLASFGICALYYYLVRRFDPFHIWLRLGTAAVDVIGTSLRPGG